MTQKRIDPYVQGALSWFGELSPSKQLEELYDDAIDWDGEGVTARSDREFCNKAFYILLKRLQVLERQPKEKQ